MMNNQNHVFKEGPNKIALGTAMYKIHKHDFAKYLLCLTFCKTSNGQLEKDFVRFFKDDYITYDKIGLGGNVSVDGKLISW